MPCLKESFGARYRGTYNSEIKGENITACLECTAGSYCPTEETIEPLPCYKGKYSDSGASNCSLCKPGRYCDQNSTSYVDMWTNRVCPAGTECPEGMDRVPDLVQDRCRKGHYCPRGDVNPFPQQCPNGTFNAEYGLKQVSECQDCTPGYYCVPEGLEQPAGTCPGGHYCPKGTAQPTTFPCPVGFYRNQSSANSFQDCTDCISGYYCDEPGLAIPKPCPAGHFCVSGSTYPQPCGLGTFSNETLLRTSSSCIPCTAGRYCDGFGLTEPSGICDAGFYCREGAYSSAPPEGLMGGLCTRGGYCPAGAKTVESCPLGYYSPRQGAKSELDCVPCDPGNFCAGTGNAASDNPCSAGYYCTGGATKQTQHECEPGHYSGAGAFKQEPCSRGQYQPSYRSSSCLECPQGYYCNSTGTVNEVICPSGHYCMLSSATPTPCPRGTYLEDVGRFEEGHCNPCKPGYACDVIGISTPVSKCAAGHYCTGGSNTTNPVKEVFGDICPAGYYCEEGTADYRLNPCDNGTYSNSTGNKASTDCTRCDPGKVCNGNGLLEPNGICSAGYFCRGGAKTDKPADGGSTGAPCVMGHYCPPGTGEISIWISVENHVNLLITRKFHWLFNKPCFTDLGDLKMVFSTLATLWL